MESSIELKLQSDCSKYIIVPKHTIDPKSYIRNILLQAQNANQSAKYELAYKVVYKAIKFVDAIKNTHNYKQNEKLIKSQLTNIQIEMKQAIDMLSKLNFIKPGIQKQVSKEEAKKRPNHK